MTIYRGKAGKFASKAEIAVLKAAEQASISQPPAREELIAYKGFHKDNEGMPSCRNFKFEIGKEYNIPDDKPNPCHKGFHACPNPFDVFNYYNLTTENIFGRVKLLGPIIQQQDKYAAKGIIVEEIFRITHLVNLLAKYALANPDKVNANINKQSTTIRTWDIKTPAGNSAHNVVTHSYSHQLSSKPNDKMYQLGYNYYQIGAASNQFMYSLGGLQISVGNSNIITNDNSGGYADIQGQRNHVRLLKENAKFRGPEGTTFELHGKDTVVHGTVGEDGVAPDKWTGLVATRINPKYKTQLEQY
jgi:hypothetical protein